MDITPEQLDTPYMRQIIMMRRSLDSSQLSSILLGSPVNFKFQMTRDLREALRIPAGSRWNIGLKSASFAFVVKCLIAKRETFLFLWSQMDVISLHVML
jgi:hypothetical protein